MQLDLLMARKELEPPRIVDIWPQGSWSSGRPMPGDTAELTATANRAGAYESTSGYFLEYVDRVS